MSRGKRSSTRAYPMMLGTNKKTMQNQYTPFKCHPNMKQFEDQQPTDQRTSALKNYTPIDPLLLMGEMTLRIDELEDELRDISLLLQRQAKSKKIVSKPIRVALRIDTQKYLSWLGQQLKEKKEKQLKLQHLSDDTDCDQTMNIKALRRMEVEGKATVKGPRE